MRDAWALEQGLEIRSLRLSSQKHDEGNNIGQAARAYVSCFAIAHEA
jgi:hypothetical protein